jgi:hypothetical protein
MASGVISPTLIPGWPTPVFGVRETLDQDLINAGFGGSILSPDGIHVGDVTIAQNSLNTYVGSAKELSFNQSAKQAALDTYLNTNFNLVAFIRAGTVTSVTGTQLANFLATINNNYRTLRAQIAAATTVAQVNAINVNSGWPSNP